MNKILFITFEYPTYTPFGGIAFYYQSIAKILSEHNFEVTVLSAKIESSFKGEIYGNEKKGLNEIFICCTDMYEFSSLASEWINKQKFKYDIIELPSYGHVLFNQIVDKSIKRAARVAIVRFHGSNYAYEVNNELYSKFIIWILARLTSFNFYLRIWKILNKKQYQKYKNAIREREYALSADVVTAPSKIMFDYLKLNGVNTKIDVFPNPCQFNLATFTSKHNKHLVISYVNRVELNKGFDLFVELVETLKSNDQYKNQTEFICMGSFENWDGNPTFLLNKNINFHNHINSSDLMDLMINTNILVVPSRFESFSNVALEGMMCSCIVIVGKNVGIRDYIVNGVNGFIIDTDEKGALENCIKYIFSLTQYEQKMICQNAFNTACEISNYEFFVSVYERLAVKPAS